MNQNENSVVLIAQEKGQDVYEEYGDANDLFDQFDPNKQYRSFQNIRIEYKGNTSGILTNEQITSRKVFKELVSSLALL